MSIAETSKVGKRGTLVIPAQLRSKFGLAEGSAVLLEDTSEGILIRPAVTLPIEVYSPERTAEFLLNNAVNEADYEAARTEVRAMGIDPENIEHERP